MLRTEWMLRELEMQSIGLRRLFRLGLNTDRSGYRLYLIISTGAGCQESHARHLGLKKKDTYVDARHYEEEI